MLNTVKTLNKKASEFKTNNRFVINNKKINTARSQMLVADRWRACNVLTPFSFFSKCDLVSESDVAVLQQRFEVLVAPRQQRVGVSTGQTRAALTGLAGRRWGCWVVWNEEGD